ncbi:MAG: alkaline phosphatase D family protein [Acidimicrobiales bacterium]
MASGDPDASSVVLWTRLVGDLPDSVDVVWEVSDTSSFDRLLATGIESTSAAFGHSIHVVADGLPPGSRWWYRFRSGDHVSPIGATRTLPDAADTRPVRVGASSCQLRETGYWAAHVDIANADLDVFCWLGDYIYEGGGSSNLPDRAHTGDTATTLDGYRHRYAEYRADPVLQASHAAHPWFCLWDDHEVENDYDASVDPARRAAAYQAWWEFMPVRLPAPDPSAPTYDIYRSLDLGERLRIVGVDVRQYANETTLFGEPQKQWIAEQLDAPTTWTLLASPVVASGIYTGEGEVLLPYTLDGHTDERRWLGDEFAKHDGQVIVSGDLHTSAVFEFSPDRRDVDSPVVATEFMAPPISSQFPERYAAAAGLLPLLNSHMAQFEPYNGWLLLSFDEQQLTAEYRRVTDVILVDSTVESAQRYQVALGDPTPVPLD